MIHTFTVINKCLVYINYHLTLEKHSHHYVMSVETFSICVLFPMLGSHDSTGCDSGLFRLEIMNNYIYVIVSNQHEQNIKILHTH